MTYLINILRPWCETKGIKLLPDDFRFIERMLYRIPEKAHKDVLRGYCKLYLSTLQETEKMAASQNMARSAANNWLREMCMGEIKPETF